MLKSDNRHDGHNGKVGGGLSTLDQHPAPTPGKRTLIEQVQGSQPAVQQRAEGEPSAAPVHGAAARGVATPATPLPFLDPIQRAFGRHDVSGVQAHTGPEAAATTRAMGAQAYATGNHVVLGGGPDLHTVAHEAAHVVQQRGGVQLKGGVGEVGDAHERHADAVADAVVQGKSAESLLDERAGGAGGAGGAGDGPVQLLRDFDAKDIEGLSEAYNTIVEAMSAQGLDPTTALIVGVGRSPVVLVKYLELRGMKVVDQFPISGLSGKKMPDYGGLGAEQQNSRDTHFTSFLDGPLAGRTSVVTIDFGASGSSNLEVCHEIGAYLARRGGPVIPVKAATISPFQGQGIEGFEALEHDDNILRDHPLDQSKRGTHRLLKVQFNSIDKEYGIYGSYKFRDVDDPSKQAPERDEVVVAELQERLQVAIAKYGEAPESHDRAHPDKSFTGKLMFQKEVDVWRKHQADRVWREANPGKARLLAAAYKISVYGIAALGAVTMAALAAKMIPSSDDDAGPPG